MVGRPDDRRDRESLHLGVLRLRSPAQRLAWLADHLNDLPGSGIIYTLTVAASQEVTDYLRERGYPVASYSGKTEQAERLAAENDLIHNRVKALVATSALGMGFDKPDLGFVIHFGAPSSPIAYYQQVGRAGRAVAKSDVILLPGDDDQAVWTYFASAGFLREEQVQQTLVALSASGAPMSTAALETRVDLPWSRLETMLKILDVDGAVKRVKGGWEATGQPWHYDADRYAKVAQVRKDEQQAMRAYIAATTCRMRFLREQLDDPYATDCGRCDNCGGMTIPITITDRTVEAASDRLTRPGVTIDPRRMWPVAMPTLGVNVRGKIKPQEMAEPGRAVARYTDLGYGPRVREALAADTDTDVPADLVAATVKVLASWDWETRPTGIVSVGSQAHPLLIQSLARRIGEIGRLPCLGPVPHQGVSRTGGRFNSAQRLRTVWGTFAVPADLSRALSGEYAGKPLLLVDDYTNTGWTITVVARLLRQAGAGQVYPLALGVEG